MEPLVSYVTVVRNGAATLERTLASVRGQRWSRVEHVIVDGMSSDGTLDIIQRHADQIDYFASEPDGGLYDALNKAIELARGDLICVLNADDWLTLDAAKLAAEAHLRAGPTHARLILTGARIELAEPGNHTQWLPQRIDAGSWLSGANVCHNGIYATPGAYEQSGPYDASMRIAADTRWLMTCMDTQADIQYIDTPTVHYSLGGLSSNVRRHTEECHRIVHERFPFLGDLEVWGLLHAFLQFRPNLVEFPGSRPPHLSRFIAEVARAHIDNADFIRTLALAGFRLLQHPEDEYPPSRLTRSERRRNSLKKRWNSLRAIWTR